MSYQSKDSLMDLLQKEIGIEKLNLLMESLNQSESHLEFCNNSEKITNICAWYGGGGMPCKSGPGPM